MAKQTETETTPVAKRETRVQFDGGDINTGSVTFKLPGGGEVSQSFARYPQATITHALQYGLRRLYQDGLAGAIKDGADADEAARGLIDRFQSGDFSRSRTAQGVSMQSVARSLVTMALRAKLGKAPSAEQVKAAVTRVLDVDGNPTGYAKVALEYQRQLAAQDAAEDLGI